MRKEIKNGSKLGKIAEEYISKGQLLPDELIVNILADTLDKCEIVKGVIFDGFPRTIPQAEALKKVLSERNMDISVVLGLEVEEKELIDRLLKRGAISGRSDDNIETINKRLEVYHSQTDPLREYYIKEGKYKPITGDGTIDDIFEKIKKVIALL